jgi:hypothetical protein
MTRTRRTTRVCRAYAKREAPANTEIAMTDAPARCHAGLTSWVKVGWSVELVADDDTSAMGGFSTGMYQWFQKTFVKLTLACLQSR